MNQLFLFLEKSNQIIWGLPLISLLLSIGVYLTCKLRFIQITHLIRGIQLTFEDEKGSGGEVSSFAALCTALAATIGTGNVVGVTVAICTGGPGALFWLVLSSFLCMPIKYAEGLLAVKYRVQDDTGTFYGGPMYYIKNHMLAKLFSIFGMLAALLGIGTMTQVQSIAQASYSIFKTPTWCISILITILAAFAILGGIKSISRVSEYVVPLMTFFYIAGSLLILACNIKNLPASILLILQDAFSIQAGIGAGLGICIRSGISSGLFSNESGLGSTPIATASARVGSAVKAGLISMSGTFYTLSICMITGLVIVVTEAYKISGSFGVEITNFAFDHTLPGIGRYIVSLGLIFFAFTTILGWNYYGECCVKYLFGTKSILPYKLFYLMAIAIAGFLKLETVWIIANIFNGLMALPNLIGILFLLPEVVRETQKI